MHGIHRGGRPCLPLRKNKILMHKDLAEKNNLKVGDKIKIKSNLFDADNEKGADEIVEVEIKGLFDGHNSGGVSAAQELYENTLITDVHTACLLYTSPGWLVTWAILKPQILIDAGRNISSLM